GRSGSVRGPCFAGDQDRHGVATGDGVGTEWGRTEVAGAARLAGTVSERPGAAALAPHLRERENYPRGYCPVTSAERLASALVDRYTIERELGQGGMA